MDTKQLTNKQKKVAVLAEMALGAGRTAMMQKYDVSSTTVLNWRKEAKEKAERVVVTDILDSTADVPLEMVRNMAEGSDTPQTVEQLASTIKEKAVGNVSTKQFAKLELQLDKLAEGITSLKMLETNFHSTIMNLLQVANMKIDEDMKISEWTQLVNGINILHGTLFGKNAGGTTINMMNQQNNGGSSAEVSKFKASFRN